MPNPSKNNADLQRIFNEVLAEPSKVDEARRRLGHPKWSLDVFFLMKSLADALRSKHSLVEPDEVRLRIDQILSCFPESFSEYEELAEMELAEALQQLGEAFGVSKDDQNAR